MKKNFLLLFLLTFSIGYSQSAAPTQPPRLPGDVISIFASAYSDISGTNFNPNWGQSGFGSFTTPSYGGDAVKQYANLNYQGTETAASVNATDINKLHIDLYSTTLTSIRFSVIQLGPTIEKPITLTLVPNQWNSFDIDLTSATFNGLDRTKIRQFKYDEPKISGVITNGRTLIVDNIYFWREAGSDPSPTISNFPAIAKVIGDAPFTLTQPTSNSGGAFTYTISPAGIATISGNTVTISDVGTATITASQAAVPGSFTAGSITTSLTVTPPAAPTPPTRNSFDVVSFYSNTYTPSSSPTWGGSTNSEISISSNPTRLFTGFTNGQIAFAATNVSQMTHVHVDVYSVNLTPMWFFLGSPGASKRLTISTPVNGWTSLDIPLSDFTSSPTGGTISLNNINLFRFENPVGATAPSRTIYIDNIYFYRPETDAPPTLGTFTVPTKVLGDAPFTLTPPTSNSSGAWSYTASPAGVASIDGDVVTIIGGGTTTISANQAAVPGEFGPGLASASFVVTYPEPGPSTIPPVREAGRVISLYTGTPTTYANVPNYNLGQAFWSTGGGRVLTEVPNGTNTALRIDGLGFMGLIDKGEVGPPAVAGERRINLVGTDMTHLNIDIYLDAPRPNLFLVLLAPGDRLYNTGPLAAGWNTLRVPLTAYPGALNDIYGLKIEQNYASPFRLFIDNIYFSNDFFTFYADTDGDGFGNAASSILAETAPEGYVTNSTDCDDTNELVWQTGDFYIDIDGDGYNLDIPQVTLCYGATFDPFYSLTTLGVDCDDNDGTINPGATEICYDGIDQNCDGNLMNSCSVITSTLRAEDCGASLATLSQVVRGNSFSQSIPSGVTVTGYRFKVTNLLTSEERIVERVNYIFQLTYTDFADYNTPYSVEVALRLNQEWMETYGAPCTITTPGVPNTVLAATSCGATLAQMNSIIRAVVVPSAISYEFEVSLIEGAVAVETTTLVKTGESLNLLQLTGISIKYGAEYSVRVKVQVPTSSGPQWSTEYGTACSVFTPLAPEASIEGCGAETGIAPAAMTTTIYASPIGGATQYKFTMTDGMAYTQTYTTPSRYFKLSNFNALQALTPGGTYSVTVEVQIYGFYYPGKDCNILVPGGAPIVPFTRAVVDSNNPIGEFKAVAYPNPFNNSFALDLKTSSTNPVSIAIYDMTGRLLETNEYNAESLAKQTIGERYPAGVYNVIVTQGENMQTVRVVKR